MSKEEEKRSSDRKARRPNSAVRAQLAMVKAGAQVLARSFGLKVVQQVESPIATEEEFERALDKGLADAGAELVNFFRSNPMACFALLQDAQDRAGEAKWNELFDYWLDRSLPIARRVAQLMATASIDFPTPDDADSWKRARVVADDIQSFAECAFKELLHIDRGRKPGEAFDAAAVRIDVDRKFAKWKELQMARTAGRSGSKSRLKSLSKKDFLRSITDDAPPGERLMIAGRNDWTYATLERLVYPRRR